MRDLSQYSQKELCEIYSNLNSWMWDERVGECPKDFDKLPKYNIRWYHRLFKRKTKADYIDPVMQGIKSRVSQKEILRYHHIYNLESSNENFERWWKENKKSYPSL